MRLVQPLRDTLKKVITLAKGVFSAFRSSRFALIPQVGVPPQPRTYINRPNEASGFMVGLFTPSPDLPTPFSRLTIKLIDYSTLTGKVATGLLEHSLNQHGDSGCEPHVLKFTDHVGNSQQRFSKFSANFLGGVHFLKMTVFCIFSK
jgi:hypothetical protein